MYDVFRQGKKRVICGVCGSILMDKEEVERLYWQIYAYDS